MVFYSTQILTKHGALGVIWIAAHLDRHLKKNQVFETSIPATVEAIINPEAPLALRLSGQLLLGVVRVYARKVGYLQHDVNEAVASIRASTKPAAGGAAGPAADAAEAQITAPAHLITLPDNYDALEMAALQPFGSGGGLSAEDALMGTPGGSSSAHLAMDLSSLEIAPRYSLQPQRSLGGGTDLFGSHNGLDDERFDTAGHIPFDLEDFEVEALRAAGSQDMSAAVAAASDLAVATDPEDDTRDDSEAGPSTTPNADGRASRAGKRGKRAAAAAAVDRDDEGGHAAAAARRDDQQRHEDEEEQFYDAAADVDMDDARAMPSVLDSPAASNGLQHLPDTPSLPGGSTLSNGTPATADTPASPTSTPSSSTAAAAATRAKNRLGLTKRKVAVDAADGSVLQPDTELNGASIRALLQNRAPLMTPRGLGRRAAKQARTAAPDGYAAVVLYGGCSSSTGIMLSALTTTSQDIRGGSAAADLVMLYRRAMRRAQDGSDDVDAQGDRRRHGDDEAAGTTSSKRRRRGAKDVAFDGELQLSKGGGGGIQEHEEAAAAVQADEEEQDQQGGELQPDQDLVDGDVPSTSRKSQHSAEEEYETPVHVPNGYDDHADEDGEVEGQLSMVAGFELGSVEDTPAAVAAGGSAAQHYNSFTARTRLVLNKLKTALECQTPGRSTPATRGSSARKGVVLTSPGGSATPGGTQLRINLSGLLAQQSSRIEASRWFFEMLVLQNQGFVQLQQEQPYEEVAVQPQQKLFS